MYSRVIVKDFGPFEHADLELKPLTIIVGRNSIGKSMLSYLTWALMVSIPDFEKLGEIVEKRGVIELANRVLNNIKVGLNPKDDFINLVKKHIEALPEAIVSNLKNVLQRTFTRSLGELIREGASKAIVRVEGPHAILEVVLKDNNVEVSNYKPYLKFLVELKVNVPRPGFLRAVVGKKVHEKTLTSIHDLASVIIDLLIDYSFKAFKPFFTAPVIPEEIAALLPDSRAGISRTLLKPYTSPTLIRSIPYSDERFIDLYYRLAEGMYKGSIDLDVVKPLIEELGCSLETVFEGGVYAIYVKTWAGKRQPFPQAPSGVREVVIVALALASKEPPLCCGY